MTMICKGRIVIVYDMIVGYLLLLEFDKSLTQMLFVNILYDDKFGIINGCSLISYDDLFKLNETDI